MPHLVAALDPLGVVMTVVGLGALIFFHELGHFLACLITKTRVEAFSVGFGPKLFGWKRGHTLYKVGAIPLGGYVKMAAENPGEQNTGAPDEFPNKPFAARLFIMSNGVLFNVILALLLYIAAFRTGVPFPRAELGDLSPGKPGWQAGLRPGDLVTAVDERRILGFDDLTMEIAFSSADETLTLTVQREGRTLAIPVRPRYSESLGRPEIGASPALDPVMAGVIPDSPLAQAGGRTGDVLLAVNGKAATRPVWVQGVVSRAAGAAPQGTREVPFHLRVRRASGEIAELEVSVPLVDQPQLGILPFAGNRIEAIAKGSAAHDLLRVGDILLAIGGAAVEDLAALRDRADPGRAVERIDILRAGERKTVVPDRPVSSFDLAAALFGQQDLDSNRVSPRSGLPAARAGLLPGDRVVRIGATRTDNWKSLHDAVREGGMEPLAVTVLRGEKQEVELTIQPARTPDPRYGLFGYQAAGAQQLHRETNILAAIGAGWRRTQLAMNQVVLTIRSLLTRRVSARHIGGPIMLARATYGMFDVGWGRYFYILALISINLAILNILPIPVLDGGQILLLCAEKLRGRPLPERVVGYFQMVGLLLILSLLVLAFRNDIVSLLN